MNTAEEILKQHLSEEGFDSFSEMVSESSDYRTESVIESCMKAYGRQVSEQALKDVKERLNDFSIDFGGLSADYETMIDTTPILTP